LRPASAPRPGLILLDLKMPKKDGYEALAEIKADPDLRRIPIVAWIAAPGGFCASSLRERSNGRKRSRI
jgi:CheY-like chemotaxis protein